MPISPVQTEISRRDALAGGITSLALSPAIGPSAAPYVGTLRERADRKGLLVGSTLNVATVAQDNALVAAIVRDSNVLVPQHGFNWTRTQPQTDMPLDFSQATPVVEVARRSGCKLRLHNLVYDLNTPLWVKALVPTLTPARAEAMLIAYIDKVFARWRGAFAHVEVVNEPGYDLTKRYRPYVFAQKLGMNYIDVAFHAARRADPEALLFTNAAALEHDRPIAEIYRTGMLKLLESLLKRGVPIQAVGIEGHIRSDYKFTPALFERFLREITGMGLKVMVTELDINDRAFSPDIRKRDAETAALAKAFLDVMFSVRECLGIVTWNGADRASWLRLPAARDRQRLDKLPLRPTPLDDMLRRKPLWGAIAAALDGAPAGR